MRDFSFSARVLEIALAIPPGKVMTYGMIAHAAGGGGQAARSITGILGKAYKNGATTIPFHRIVYANGTVFTNETYNAERMRLYKKEGIAVSADGKIQDFQQKIYTI